MFNKKKRFCQKRKRTAKFALEKQGPGVVIWNLGFKFQVLRLQILNYRWQSKRWFN
jgi:hypothetical protein